MSKRVWFLLGLAGLVGSACGGATADDPVALTNDPIVDGEPATARKYDPIGALVDVAPDGTTSAFCTGALVYPKVVVTAKHCLLLTAPDAKIAFAIGPDASKPDRVIPIVGRVWERTVTEGIMALGSDVAVVTLEKPVYNVKRVAIGGMRDRLVDAGFLAVGYGEQSWFFEDPEPPFGTRAKGSMTLAGIGPAPYWPTVYDGDYDSYLADYLVEFPPELHGDPGVLALIEADWQGTTMTEDYDAVFRANPANTSAGDSGGPILKRRWGRWVSYGVTSGIMFLGGDDDWTVLKNNAVYSTFGPEAAHLVRSAPFCKGVPEEGQCSGNKLSRCTAVGEGFPRVKKKKCADTCVEAPAGAQCAAACASDADCDSVAANGTCEAGVCTWSALEKCKAEPGAGGCFLCCLGQATGADFEVDDLITCSGACFPGPPVASGKRVVLPSFPQVSWQVP